MQTWKQTGILIGKNFTIIFRDNEPLKEMVIPILTFGLLLGAKLKDDNPIFQIFALYFIPISLMSVTRSVTYQMVEEKSSKQKEIQKIMGVKQSSYVIGWFLSNLLKFGYIVVIFLTLCLSFKVLAPLDNSFSPIQPDYKTWYFAVGYILFGLAQMALSYFLSVFFSVPKTAADVSILISFVGDLLISLYGIEYVSEHQWIVFLMSLSPSTCFTRIVFERLAKMDFLIQFTVKQSFMMLIVDMVVYFLLYIYLDQVVPNEYGTHKHPLFFIQCLWKKNKSRRGVINEEISLPLQQNNHDFDDTSDFSSALYHQSIKGDNLKKSMEIIDVKKAFGETLAVNGVTLNIYESQLLCLLGHNGAGKTTLISLVTGLINKDSGKVKFYGQSIDDDIDEIRQITGICVQKDVLYDKLNVEEHLRYYARMKGFYGQQLEEEIEYIINKCCLKTERNKLSKELSGGNKRKLSLGMALIGKSKIVFLDEPTSGMDPVTRRAIWSILQDLKSEKRTLILTTHHLDEAEHLSERIAIMAKGKLLTVGSSEFIKKNFGIGYHLGIYANRQNFTKFMGGDQWEQKKQKIRQYIIENVKGCKYNPQSADDTLLFTLPYNEKKNLLPVFQTLEEDQSIQIDLSMNTLEEAFINIGMDEEKFIQRTRRFSQQAGNVQSEPTSKIQDFSDFSQIPVPPCLSNPPQYKFWNQFYACLLRKLYVTRFGKRLFMQIILPAYFAFAGAFACYLNKKQLSDDESNPVDLKILYGFNLTFDMAFGYSMAASNVAGIPVEERENKLKYALNVMGCRVTPYWLATMFFDFILFLMIDIILIAFLIIFQTTDMLNVGSVILLITTSFAVVGISYSVSWLYQRSNLAFKTVFFLILILFLVIPFVLLVAFQNKFMFWLIAFISPFMCLLEGLTIGAEDSFSASNHYIVFILIQILQGLAGLFLCIYIDTRSLVACTRLDHALIQANEADVIDEANRVAEPNCSDSVKAIRIAKQYSNGFFAVKGTSFGVEQSQVFGLLGPNGAGKSTTFNMITSKLKPTSGRIYLKNQIAEKGNSELYQNVGICPQFDCIWELMTPIEHLKIFALIKGLTGPDILQSVSYFIRIMQLDQFVKTKAGKLSGGNKRKLCVAIACIGSPSLQFFDEPSSGVDPIARRFLWNTIQQGLKLNKSAVVLTTHSMDEAEGLCTKIAIQVNGTFVCYGSPQHLKAKYGSGYRISVEVERADVNIIEAVKGHFPNAQILPQNQQNQLVFQFPPQNFSFYKVFDFFLNNLQNQQHAIKDFQITQSSLEQVFLYFATFQENREQEVFVPKNKGFLDFFRGEEDE